MKFDNGWSTVKFWRGYGIEFNFALPLKSELYTAKMTPNKSIEQDYC